MTAKDKNWKKKQIKAKTTEIYLSKLEYFYSEYGKVLKDIANFVGKIDFF